MKTVESEIISKLRETSIDCPHCKDMDSDDQYTCEICWCEGGNGTINVFRYLRENESFTKSLLPTYL